LNGIQEVGGSTPPGSTSLRSLRELRLASRPDRGGFFVALDDNRLDVIA
jgi:hypothetical protein